ncbi:helix-turn-helix transcriptional regulator [Actinocorallia sp. B10E7]|uniref:helix-turn-helix domain-containing protein n=1 Tax=Actinocorallia sp. B10E7 TaxID=3153558 RepID=UPI00325CC85B
MSHAAYESDPDALRAHFAIELRRQRTRAGLSMNQLARALGCTPQWVSQLEQTVKPVPEQSALDVDTYFKTDGWQENDGLFIRIHRAIQRAGQRRVLRQDFETYLKFEQQAQWFSSFANQAVPGLLQTREYATALMNPHHHPEALAARVDGRMGRQEILNESRLKKAMFVVDEAVLRRPLGGPEVMAEQVERLICYAESPTVQIRVLPFAHATSLASEGSFVILGYAREDDLVYFENIGMGQLIEERDKVSDCTIRFADILGEALPRAESMQFLKQVREDYL